MLDEGFLRWGYRRESIIELEKNMCFVRGYIALPTELLSHILD